MGDLADDIYDRFVAGFDDDDEPRDTHIRCQHCGKSAWWRNKDGWKLFNLDGTRHLCLRRPATADDFDDCSTA